MNKHTDESFSSELKRTGLLSQLLDHIPYSVYYKDLESRFIAVNKECTEKFGLDNPDELIGKTDFDFF